MQIYRKDQAYPSRKITCKFNIHSILQITRDDIGFTKLSEMLITPLRPIVPKVGRNAVTPHRAAGKVMDPAVSVPNANGTIPVIQ